MEHGSSSRSSESYGGISNLQVRTSESEAGALLPGVPVFARGYFNACNETTHYQGAIMLVRTRVIYLTLNGKKMPFTEQYNIPLK